MATKKTTLKSKKGLTFEQVKKDYFWKVIPIDKLPDNTPVVAIQFFASKDLAKFHLIEDVIIPVPKSLIKTPKHKLK